MSTVIAGLYNGSPRPLRVDASGSIMGARYGSTVSFTRPANTTAYSAGDVVGATAAALTFSGIAGGAEVIEIVESQLTIALTSVPASMTTFTLHLYSVTPPSALADNAVWDLPAGDIASYLGYINLGTIVDVGASLHVQTLAHGKQIKTASSSVFAYLETDGGFTPSSGEAYTLTLYAKAL